MVRRRSDVMSPPSPPPPAAPPSLTLTHSPPPSLRIRPKMPEPLDTHELSRLFSGAPQFSLMRIDDDEKDEFALQPEVTFPFGGGSDEEGDFRSPGHAALALCTAGEEEAIVAREVPPMASFLGWEPGTVGWDYFLMLPAGDADRDPDESEFEDNLDEGGRERGGGMRERERGGVRSVEVEYIVERLKELGAIWQAKKKRRAQQMGRAVPGEESEGDGDGEENGGIPTSVEMYTHLFTHLLYPPTRIATDDYADPYSLKVQITALIHALGKKMWLDFSIVRWRIKLGQILWGDAATTAVMGDDQDVEEYEEWEAATKESERVWLLLQILLACELLVRMDTVLSEEEDRNQCRSSVRSNWSNQSAPESKEQMLHRFRQEGGRKVQWDIVLAHRWLENIRIEMEALHPKDSPFQKAIKKSSFLSPPSRWFGVAQASPSPEHSSPSTPDLSEVTDALLLPRNPRRQIEGLLHFARKLQWPNLDSLAQQVTMRAPASSTPSSSGLGTPLACGVPLSTAASSYFPGPMPRPKRLLEIASDVVRQKSANLTVPSVSGRGGWLSRSYLTGLVLPGEGLNHLVIATLLENDQAAAKVLGFNANLYGGFQYLGKTWWSRYCIVGRVMAGFDGAEEESGWVGPVKGSGIAIEGEGGTTFAGNISDGWIDVLTQPSPDSKSPRALAAGSVERDCDIRGRGWKRGTEPREDAFAAVDIGAAIEDADVEVQVRGLYFNPAEQPLPPVRPPTEEEADDAEAETPDPQTYEVAAHILVGPRGGKKLLYVLELKYGVSFVSAWPCFPPLHQQGHLLHCSYGYACARIEELPSLRQGNDDARTLVVNTWSPAQRVLLYAWCAHRGRSAVVATRGRTCIACAVREAGALALGVVVVV